MLRVFVSFVTVVDQKPWTDLYPRSPVFRSLFYQVSRACWGSSLRGKQNICAGQAGSAGRSKSAERFEEGQNLPWRPLFNQKEVTVSDLVKRIPSPAPWFNSRFKVLAANLCRQNSCAPWMCFTNPFNTSPSRFLSNDGVLFPIEPENWCSHFTGSL